MKTCIINHKRYTVERRFNMVANFYFTDKRGIEYLVDAEDVAGWNEEEHGKATATIDDAIAYARDLAEGSEDGIFWWKMKAPADIERELERIRQSLKAENISYGEVARLQELAEFIDPGDVELLEAAGVPEGTR